MLKEKKTALGKQARAGVEPSTTFVIDSTPLTTNLPAASVGPSAPPPPPFPPRLQSSKKKKSLSLFCHIHLPLTGNLLIDG